MAVDSVYNLSLYDYDYSLYYDEFGLEEHQVEMKSTFLLFSAVCYILIFCISVPANGFLLWVLLREQAWKITSDILLLQLIISDLCLTVSLPFWACFLLHGWIFWDWVFGVIRGAYLLGLSSYVLILTAMTFYRYVAVVRASRLSAQAPKKSCVLMASIMIWLVCAAASIEVSVSFTVLLFDIYMQICFFIPFIIITFFSVHMWITIRQINRHHQASRLILGLIVVFFLCFAPYNIILFIKSLLTVDVLQYTVEWQQAMYYLVLADILLYFHCCLNPLLHIFGAQRFRRHLPVPRSTASQRRDGSQNHISMAVIPPHDATV